MTKLSEEFAKFAKSNNLPSKEDAQKFLVKNNHYFKAGEIISKAIIRYGETKSKFSLLESAFNLITEVVIGDNKYYDSFLEENQWARAKIGDEIDFFINSLFIDKSCKSMMFKSDKLLFVSYGDIEFAVCKASYGAEYFYRREDREFVNSEQLNKIIIQKYIEKLNCNNLQLVIEGKNLTIKEADVKFEGILNEETKTYVKKYLDAGINRSFLYYGAPGVGKTTLINQIVDHFKLRTFYLSLNSLEEHHDIIIHLLQIVNFDAVVFNDLDQISDDPGLLEILEFLNKKAKLTLITVNSLAEFHPAALRPGRVDELFKIDRLPEAEVLKILGGNKYLNDVKDLPVAYIRELVLRMKVESSESKILEIIKDLKSRASKQADKLS